MSLDWLHDKEDVQESLKKIYDDAKQEELKKYGDNRAEEVEEEFKQEVIRPLFYKGFMNVDNKRYYNVSRIVFVEVDENGRSKIQLDDGNLTSCSASAKDVIDTLYAVTNMNGDIDE